MTDKLTDEQLKNWRRVLFLSFGPFALIASDDEIQEIRDIMQAGADMLSDETEDAELHQEAIE